MENIAVNEKEKSETKEICMKHKHRYVCVWVKDGSMYDGIVENVDDENIYMAVPIGGANNNMPNTANAPYQSNMPYQANAPYQSNMPYQANAPYQSNMPYQADMPANVQPEANQPYDDCGCGGMRTRAFGYPFAGYPGAFPGYGYGYGYPAYPFYGRRRFNRLILPLAALTAIGLLPYY
ncbi:hypothetical protein [Paenibacillus medicaginis]|uniref:Uncharacterized protein n=1 Tax=Paenibacillus medicaginis TaxID=1470560 RepID=A0ABV5C5C4_9BACL